MSDPLRLLFDSTVNDFGLAATREGMDRRISSFLSARESKVQTTLRDFACPAASLADLTSILGSSTRDTPLGIAVVAGEDRGDWESERIEDASRMNDFQSKSDNQAEIHTYSVSAPDHLGYEETFESLRGFSAVNVQVVLNDAETLGDAISLVPDREWISLALDHSAIQSLESLSRFMVECSGLEVPYQILELHGSLVTRGTDLGILNVLTAAALAFSDELSAAETAQILGWTDTAPWRASAGYFGPYSADLKAIEESKDICWGVGVMDLQLFLNDLDAFGLF